MKAKKVSFYMDGESVVAVFPEKVDPVGLTLCYGIDVLWYWANQKHIKNLAPAAPDAYHYTLEVLRLELKDVRLDIIHS